MEPTVARQNSFPADDLLSDDPLLALSVPAVLMSLIRRKTCWFSARKRQSTKTFARKKNSCFPARWVGSRSSYRAIGTSDKTFPSFSFPPFPPAPLPFRLDTNHRGCKSLAIGNGDCK